MKYNQVEPFINQNDIKNVLEYLNSKAWITEHNQTKKLEENISNFVNRKYAIAVPNGTIALYLSLISLNLKGKKVAVPNLTMIATINAVLWANAIPVLVDVDENLCMSYEMLKKTKGIDALIFVPLNGRGGDGEKIKLWCDENNIKFIEDSAHALGSSYTNTKCGGLGELSILSFTPHKIITMGQGGMILTNDDRLNDFLINLKTFNRKKNKSDWHKGFGLNFKITDLQASLGLSQFEKIYKFIENKKNNHNYYLKFVQNKNLEVLKFHEYEVPWFFEIKSNSISYLKKLKKELMNVGIETREMYPALSKQSYLNKYKHNNLKFSENVFNKILWLPSSNNLAKKDIKIISNHINSII